LNIITNISRLIDSMNVYENIYKPDVYISMIDCYDMVEYIFGLEKDLAHHLKSITSNHSLVKPFAEGLDSVENFKLCNKLFY
jgi:hypothetical protein